MSKVLVSYFTFRGTTKTLAEAAAEGARNAGAEVTTKEVAETTVQDLADADVVIIATPQPFGGVAGETKKLLERTWREREKIGKKPLGLLVTHIGDTTDTFAFMEKWLCGQFGFEKSQDWLAIKGSEAEAGKEKCRQWGADLAIGA